MYFYKFLDYVFKSKSKTYKDCVRYKRIHYEKYFLCISCIDTFQVLTKTNREIVVLHNTIYEYVESFRYLVNEHDYNKTISKYNIPSFSNKTITIKKWITYENSISLDIDEVLSECISLINNLIIIYSSIIHNNDNINLMNSNIIKQYIINMCNIMDTVLSD